MDGFTELLRDFLNDPGIDLRLRAEMTSRRWNEAGPYICISQGRTSLQGMLLRRESYLTSLAANCSSLLTQRARFSLR